MSHITQCRAVHMRIFLEDQMMKRLSRGAVVAIAGAALMTTLAASAADYHGRKAWTLQNDKIQVIVTPGGGHIASMTLRSGSGSGVNPLWLPPWKSSEPGEWEKAGGFYGDKPGAQLLSTIMGQNVCLDFFGAPSPEEIKAGIPVHGEAPTVNWAAITKSDAKLSYGTFLPNAQMKVTRSISLAPGSSALWISETVENQTAFDRPFGWNQHVTLGPPFLEAGVSRYDMNATWGMVDGREFSKGQRLKQGGEFEWPNAPGANGESIDLRTFPGKEKTNSDFTANVMTTDREWVYFTAINPKKHLLIGYLWPRKDWPWAANWEENHFRTGTPWKGKAVARGIEFGTTPFAYSRRDVVTMGKLHDTPTYRWIAAREKQTISYAAFLAPIPEGTTGVTDVKMTKNGVEISLEGADKPILLALKK